MIKDENGMLVTYVYADTSESDLGGYVERARAALSDLKLPAGYRIQWTGQYELAGYELRLFRAGKPTEVVRFFESLPSRHVDPQAHRHH